MMHVPLVRELEGVSSSIFGSLSRDSRGKSAGLRIMFVDRAIERLPFGDRLHHGADLLNVCVFEGGLRKAGVVLAGILESIRQVNRQFDSLGDILDARVRSSRRSYLINVALEVVEVNLSLLSCSIANDHPVDALKLLLEKVSDNLHIVWIRVELV